jgi:hypothetical protein
MEIIESNFDPPFPARRACRPASGSQILRLGDHNGMVGLEIISRNSCIGFDMII